MDRYYPSSRTCCCCGYVYEHLDLRDRQRTCPQCGTTLDRDVNAATNIMRQGIASSESPRKTKVRLRKWLVKNGIAEDTGVRTVSGFCTYPLLQFNHVQEEA